MIRKILRRLVLREKADSERYVNYLRKQGVPVGENVRFYDPVHTHVDLTAPWLLTIGNDVRITRGVTLLTHDYAWSVVKDSPDRPGQILGCQRPVKIGNNVFIGMNAVITAGVSVGDHVIIGAGSVVTADCESSSVYAGNPARKICTLAEYRQKRREKQFAEAKELARCYRQRFGRDPEPEVFHEYFSLFCTAEQAMAVPAFRRQMESGGDPGAAAVFLEENPPRFGDFETFLAACREDAVW